MLEFVGNLIVVSRRGHFSVPAGLALGIQAKRFGRPKNQELKTRHFFSEKFAEMSSIRVSRQA